MEDRHAAHSLGALSILGKRNLLKINILDNKQALRTNHGIFRGRGNDPQS